MIAGIFILGCIILIAGYRIFGRYLERQFDINPNRPTPAITMTDGVDYVPARTPVLFGHHFSSIAGAVPIVGPIMAGAAFGWLPPLVWLIAGAVLIGGVHDFSALVTSIRHKARSIAEIARIYLSPSTYRLFLLFIWVALVYVLIVFVDLTSSTFAPPVAKIIDETQRNLAIKNGGVVATTSIIYIFIAFAFGILLYKNKFSLKTGSFIFVPLVFIALWVAQYIPLSSNLIPTIAQDNPKLTWSIALILYCFIASVLPVWMLLQPRDYLSSFLLFACVLGGGIGLIVTGAKGDIALQFPAFITANDQATSPPLGLIFPALFITVACGAVSGFHSIVASGTTAKQLSSEKAARPVAYGAMLVETVLGLIALSTLMMVQKPGVSPQATFASGMGQFFSVFGIKPVFGVAFALLAISTFLLTTLDTCTRLARYILEELLSLSGRKSRYLTTLLTLIIPLVVMFIRIPDPSAPGTFLPAWRAVFPVFGATNQLLAVFALLAVMVWRVHLRKSYWFVLWPMIFMLATTFTQLAMLVSSGQSRLITILAGVLLVVAVALLGDTLRCWKKITSAKGLDEEEEQSLELVKIQ